MTPQRRRRIIIGLLTFIIAVLFVLCVLYAILPIPAIHKAAMLGLTVRVQWLTKSHPESIHKRDIDSKTPLHWAVIYNHEDTVQALLELGANPNVKDTDGRHNGTPGQTPLYEAIQNGNAEIASILLEGGSDPNFADREGVTPLHDATYYGQPEIVKLLLAHGAIPEATDENGETALSIAQAKGDNAIIGILEGLQGNIGESGGSGF